MDLRKLLHTVFLRSPSNLFDEFVKECQAWYSQPAHSLQEMRTRDSKKIRGDIFEEFCCLYLKEVKGFQDVWLLPDLPEELLEQLSLKRRDMGIDIIVRHNKEWYAVQCKYKTPQLNKKSYITWSALSTFYAMCLRTGPWAKYIVMTNCDYTRHQGEKGPKDMSICLGTFRNIKSEEWLKMSKVEGQSMQNEITKKLTIEELRAHRLAFYNSSSP
jgi:predicted helicase